MRILAGDIGGTKTLLRLVELDSAGAPGHLIDERRFASADYADLTPMVREFLAPGEAGIEAACFGVAGPVEGDRTRQRARLTNLPWQLDSAALAEALAIPRLRLINDFQAVGYGIEALQHEQLASLQPLPGEADAPRLVVGAGTGLGVGLLCPLGSGRYEAYPTEGGHMAFAPADETQEALLRHLRGIHGRVSYERLVSGPGLVAIYRFLLEHLQAPPAAQALLQTADPAAAISTEALAREDSPAARALDIFIDAYGAVAGDLALATLATGGVYIAGGIAPRLLPRLQRGDFLAAFRRKGRMSHLVASMPLHVVTDPLVGLTGAVVAAGRL